ncbi:serine protease [Gordoniibacillus kamchatkensis]|uniref:Serine protease n=1 Tax=Gordoniibacillus kamchatkensis TaxID=1590651 RepID=A0ABR5AL04_9BACL|nr:S8 family peptidase [Paenibacillus sp. VKM B-2647]KIL41717.1 serine protease [Paenibacillus sp. VKM B-2647]
MWRYVLSLAVIAAFGLLLVAGRHHPNDSRVHPLAETSDKHLLVQQDVQRTDELCRVQCSLDFRDAVQKLQGKTGSEARAVLEDMRSKHAHMDRLVWSKREQALEQGTAVGTVDGGVEQAARTYMKAAKEAALRGQTYQSPKIEKGEEAYFVLGQPSPDGTWSLVGLVHQQILAHVADHQRKNLRLQPFPAESHPKIQSVDANTLNNKAVLTPDDRAGTSHYHQNEVVVRFKNTPTEAQLRQIQREIGAAAYQKLGYTYVFRAEKLEAKALMDYFRKWDVAYAEPHYFYMTNETDNNGFDSNNGNGNDNDVTGAGIAPIVPNDYLFSRYQWNLPITDTTTGWQVNKGDKSVTVAVVDTGVDLGHADLQGNLVSGYNVVNPNNAPVDDVGHGTHVAGIISALVNNGIGVAGMTWYNPVMPVKVLDASGSGSTYAVAQGVIWATDHGAKVINMSLGNYADAQFLHDAVKYAYDHDVVLIAASGNDNTDRPGYPAAYPEVFAVAASDSNNNKAPFSNYGDYIDVAAPGVSIASTYMHNQYAALSGTSMASPHVTALAALIRSTNPLLKNTEVMDIMRKSAKDIGPPGKDPYFGYGLIDVVKAVQMAQQAKFSMTYWPQWTTRQLQQISQKYAIAAAR